MANTFSMGSRIKQARKDKKLSQEKLGNALGVTKQAVSQWETGGTAPRKEQLIEISRILHVSMEWLLTGTENYLFNKITEELSGKGVPLYTLQEAANIEETSPSNDQRSSIPNYFNAGPNSFAIEITDDSMSPEYNPGDIIIIDPEIVPIPGDHVCAYVDGFAGAILRVYKSSGANSRDFTLSAINDSWQDIKNSGQVIGVMIQHIKPRKKSS